MRAGLLRHSITIVQPGTKRGRSGGVVPGDDVTVLETFASVNGLSGKEVYAAGAGFSGQITHKIVIRYPNVVVASGMAVLFRSRRFTIQFTQDPDETQRELDLICLEQSTPGATA